MPLLILMVAACCIVLAGTGLLLTTGGTQGGALPLSWPRRLVRARVQKRAPLVRQVIVVTRDGTSIRGVLLSELGPHYELANAEIAHKGERAFGPVLDGKVLVQAGNVEYIQVF